jgi:urea transporter
MGVPHHAISAGLYGFSAVLTAIALATVFYRPCLRSAIWALFGIVVTVFVQAAMNIWVEPYSIATLTGPFCVTTWLFLLPMFKLDEAQPDHSSWGAEIKQHLSKEDNE